jgi:cytochrome c-type biogenesis protein CcmH/NrfG
LSRESIAVGIAGVVFGLLVGWILGAQQADRGAAPPPPQTSAAPAASNAQSPPPLDESRAASLRSQAEQRPKDAAVRVQLANLYFDAERFQDAAQWYEAALRIDPKDVNASTDLGIAYYYMNQSDKALAQFDESLRIDPNHAKTLLNMGIVRAFAKQDLEGAAAAWEQVLKVAPDSPEARAARQALDGIRAAHQNVGQPSGAGR